MSVGVGRTSRSVCLSVCPQHNSKTNDPKVFKLGVGNELGIYQKSHGFGIEMSKFTVTGSMTLHNNTSFQITIAFHSHSIGGHTDRRPTIWLQPRFIVIRQVAILTGAIRRRFELYEYILFSSYAIVFTTSISNRVEQLYSQSVNMNFQFYHFFGITNRNQCTLPQVESGCWVFWHTRCAVELQMLFDTVERRFCFYFFPFFIIFVRYVCKTKLAACPFNHIKKH